MSLRLPIRRTFEGREHTIGASEIGQCARKLFWTKNQEAPVRGACRNPAYFDSWGSRVRGSTFEDHFWLPAPAWGQLEVCRTRAADVRLRRSERHPGRPADRSAC